jgi:NitT/TauT family transport system ATP-binding protein
MFQHREAANFPWVSQAEWLYSQMVRWDGLTFDPADAAKAARVFRPDVYRSALLGTGEPLPGASSKVEGSLHKPTSVSMQQGVITLEKNSFFDCRPFDPELLESYIESQRRS